MTYATLFFDLDDTLWDFRANAGEALREAYALNRLDRLFDHFDHFFALYWDNNQQLWELYRQGNITKAELNRRRFLYPLEQVGTPDETLALAISADFLRICPTKRHLVEGCRQTLDYLAGHNYRMAIISNGFSELQHNKLNGADIARYFDKVIMSDAIGRHKPHPDIFRHALTSLNARRHTSLMIGDNWEADIIGARRAGIHQAYFGKPIHWDTPPTYHIQHLPELIEIL